MPKLNDLTGRRFGRLTVLYRAENIIDKNGRSRVQWHCICDCGNACDVASDLLLKGKTQSCGCLRKETAFNQNFKDLTGQRFGKLVVLYENKNDIRKEKFGNTIWHCLCDCGNECDVSSTHLVTGQTLSCGCLQKERASNASTKDIRKYDDNGNVVKKLCPCCQQWLPIEKFQKHKPSKDGHASVCKICSAHRVTSRYSAYRTNANKHQREFDLTLEEFDDITKQPCYYCGGYNGEFQGVSFSGIDRIDSDKGYTKDNIIPCCGTCNRMKNNLSQEFWIQHMQKILNHLTNNK